jgi:hypothetical protein
LPGPAEDFVVEITKGANMGADRATRFRQAPSKRHSLGPVRHDNPDVG